MPDIFDASAINPNPPDIDESTQTSLLVDEPLIISDSVPTEPAVLQTPEPTSNGRIVRDVDEYSDVMKDEKPSSNPFQSFAPKPQNVFFDSQHREERVLLLLRRHPITQIPWILMVIAMAFVPLLLSSVGFLDFLPERFQIAAGIGWYMLLFSFILESFLIWFFNVYIITDERVIDVDFHNLIYKNVSAAKIDTVQDITTVAGGVVASIFDYGTVKIQTSAAVTEFEFEDVPHPARVTSFLNELLVEEERERFEQRVN